MNNGYSLNSAAAKSVAGRGNPISTSAEALIVICAFFVPACYGRLYGALFSGRFSYRYFHLCTACRPLRGNNWWQFSKKYEATAMSTLAFNNTTLSTVPVNNQPWLTAGELSRALGYRDSKSIQRIYTRNADEFTTSMTSVVKLTTPGGPQETRIFSLRGCHLIAMLSRTPMAKQFRQWVLDVIEKNETQTLTPTLLQQIINTAVQQAPQAIMLSVMRQIDAAQNAAESGKDVVEVINNKYTHGVTGVPTVNINALKGINSILAEMAEVRV